MLNSLSPPVSGSLGLNPMFIFYLQVEKGWKVLASKSFDHLGDKDLILCALFLCCLLNKQTPLSFLQCLTDNNKGHLVCIFFQKDYRQIINMRQRKDHGKYKRRMESSSKWERGQGRGRQKLHSKIKVKESFCS